MSLASWIPTDPNPPPPPCKPCHPPPPSCGLYGCQRSTSEKMILGEGRCLSKSLGNFTIDIEGFNKNSEGIFYQIKVVNLRFGSRSVKINNFSAHHLSLKTTSAGMSSELVVRGSGPEIKDFSISGFNTHSKPFVIDGRVSIIVNQQQRLFNDPVTCQFSFK